MKNIVSTLLLCFAASGAVFAETVSVASVIPYGEDDTVSSAIKQECNVSGSILGGLDEGVTEPLQKVETASSTGAGRNLVMEISDAQSSGNAFIGHRKSVSAKGRLYENGKLISSFRASRVSMGGAMGAFKGSCTVIHACGHAIGKDVARWLASPVDGARLGDLN